MKGQRARGVVTSTRLVVTANRSAGRLSNWQADGRRRQSWAASRRWTAVRPGAGLASAAYRWRWARRSRRRRRAAQATRVGEASTRAMVLVTVARLSAMALRGHLESSCGSTSRRPRRKTAAMQRASAAAPARRVTARLVTNEIPRTCTRTATSVPTRRVVEERRTMMPRSDRCPTRSGSYQCDEPAGHAGPCETVEPATPWVGPASRVQRLQKMGGSSRIVEWPFAATRMPQDASAAGERPAGASAQQGGA